MPSLSAATMRHFAALRRPAQRVLLGALALVGACSNELGDEPFDFQVEFTCESDRETADQLRLIMHKDSCSGAPVYDVTLAHGEPAKPSEELSPGLYGFEAIALKEGALLAQGCTVSRVPGGRSIQLNLASDNCRKGVTIDPSTPNVEQPDASVAVTPNETPVVKADAGQVSTPTQPPVPPACTGSACGCPEGCSEGAVCENGACRPAQSLGSSCTAQRFQGRDYLFCGERVLWNSARTRCRSYGMGLVSIESAAENEFVRRYAGGVDRWLGANDLGESDLSLFADITLDLSNGIPLGKDLSCRKIDGVVGEGSWYWSSKKESVSNETPLCTFSDASATSCTPAAGSYQNWLQSQPNNNGCICAGPCWGGQDCAIMRAADGGWDDETCGFVYAAFVCEAP